MAIDKSLVSGSMAMMILKLLSEKDMYGYEMIDTLRKRSENVFELKAGTLYPLLHSLEDKRYLLSYEQEAVGKIRKYYQITKNGRKHLEEKKSQWQEYSRAVMSVLALEV
ncbi:MAG: PadR family transcriptional regulator [Lachnospiraceae bacterium]|jgi:PadR family transcriptional regulator PadR|nr:PadR family transcriptional regulator [Lachnospiraceae bacterium]MCI9600161.1 PadR family transcriptional regulator [Lachnospiraceae bacterium]